MARKMENMTRFLQHEARAKMQLLHKPLLLRTRTAGPYPNLYLPPIQYLDLRLLNSPQQSLTNTKRNTELNSRLVPLSLQVRQTKAPSVHQSFDQSHLSLINLPNPRSKKPNPVISEALARVRLPQQLQLQQSGYLAKEAPATFQAPKSVR